MLRNAFPKKSEREHQMVLPQTVEKPQFCVMQNWGFEHIVAKI